MAKRHIVVTLLAVLLPSHVAAATFDLTKVVDKNTPIPGGTGTFACFLGYSISGDHVVFWGSAFKPPFFCRPSGIYEFNGTTLGKVADTNTAIPEGVGTFSEFGIRPLISGSHVAFEGFGSDGQRGIYLFDGTMLKKVVDTNTPVPGGTGPFSDFFGMAASGSSVAFLGSGPGNGGVYLFDGSTLKTVADRTTQIPPGGLGNFSGFGSDSVAMSGTNVVFDAAGDSFGQEGIYLFDGATLRTVADTSTAIPGGTGDFVMFLQTSVVISGDTIAFKALGSGFDEGIYVFDGAALRKVVDRNTPIPGGTGTFDEFAFPAIDDGRVAFVGTSAAEKHGLYLFDGALRVVADTTTPVPGGPGTFTSFFAPAMSGGSLVFDEDGTLGEQGIQLFNGTTISPVADTDTPIPGGPGMFAGFASPPAISDGHVAFAARSSVGQDGIYLATRDPIGPVKVWLGLRNSDDVGLRLDIRAEVLRNDVVVASGELDNQSAGSSGFSNALLRPVRMTPTGAPVAFESGDTVAVEVSVRRTCSGTGHNAGAVRLWYGGRPIDTGSARAAGTRVDATVAGLDEDFFLADGFLLSPTPGSATRPIDVFVDSKTPCPDRPFTSFGVWTVVLP